MKVRELIHELSAEHVDPNAEVYLTVDEVFTVEDVRSTAPWGVERVELVLGVRSLEDWFTRWGKPADGGTVNPA